MLFKLRLYLVMDVDALLNLITVATARVAGLCGERVSGVLDLATLSSEHLAVRASMGLYLSGSKINFRNLNIKYPE